MSTPPFQLIASFLAFIESDNMQQAASSLQMSQPALTSHLKSFESYFPQPIFTMQGRRKVLTSFGEEVKDLLKKRFDHLGDDLEIIKEKVQDAKALRVRIAGRSEILNILADRIHFQGTLQFNPIYTESAISEILNRKCDIAITYETPESHDLHAKKFFLYGYAIAIPSKWKIKSTRLSQELFEHLIELPVVSHRPQTEGLNVVLQKYNIDKKPQFKKILPDWVKLASMIGSGEGWGIIPTYFANTQTGIDIIPIPTSLMPEVQFYLLYRKETSMRPWFKNIVEQLLKSTAES